MCTRSKICLIAIGTVGDILPLVHLAVQLCDDTADVSLSSHVDHQRWLLPLIEGAGVAFLPLELPPARTWNSTSKGHRPAACASGTDKHLEACIGVCEDALGIKLGDTDLSKAHPNRQDGSTVCHRLIVHNLFALEGFHIAEALGVPSVAVSACLPYPPPASFHTRFKAAYSRLWKALQHQGEGVRWTEIEHWMWPLFTERWGAWRQERLRLPAVPYLTVSTLPAAPPLLLCLSPCLVDQPPAWPPSIRVCGSVTEYGFVKRKGQHWPGTDTSQGTPWQSNSRFGMTASEETATCGERNVVKEQDRDVIGSGKAREDNKRRAMSESALTDEAATTETLKAADTSSAPTNRPRQFTVSHDGCNTLNLIRSTLKSREVEVDLVCIDFGSMGSMGLLGDAKQVVEILALALEQIGVCGVLLTGQWDALMNAHMELSDCTSMVAVKGFVDHAELFSRCSAVVHHGGAGTVASALRAGLPSVICPLQFDQFMWADRLEHMGLGKVVPGSVFKESSVGAAAAELSAALSELMGSNAFKSDCERVQREMAAEDGIAVAAASIRQLLCAHFEVRPVYDRYDLIKLPNGLEIDASSPSEVDFLYREIFEEQIYLQHGITVQDGDVVVDVGANIGLFTLHLLVELGKQPSHIWAIEPLEPTVRRLRRNIAAFMAEDQATVIPMALGRTAATKDFIYYPNMPGNATSRPEEKAALQEGCMHASYFEDSSTHACQVTTLDHLMSQHAITKIDLLKVDVEGDEEEVLMGMTQWEAVAQVVAEVHEVNGRVERIKELLQSHGFLVVVDRGSAPSAVMLYAAKEGRLLGEHCSVLKSL